MLPPASTLDGYSCSLVPGRHRHRWFHCWEWCESGPPPSWGPPGPSRPSRRPRPRGVCWPPSASASCLDWPRSSPAGGSDSLEGRSEGCGRRRASPGDDCRQRFLKKRIERPSLEVVGDYHRRMGGLRPGERRGSHRRTRRLLGSRHISLPVIVITLTFSSSTFQLASLCLESFKTRRRKVLNTRLL